MAPGARRAPGRVSLAAAPCRCLSSDSGCLSPPREGAEHPRHGGTDGGDAVTMGTLPRGAMGSGVFLIGIRDAQSGTQPSWASSGETPARAAPGVCDPKAVSLQGGTWGQQLPLLAVKGSWGGWGRVRAPQNRPLGAPAPPLGPCQPLIGVLLLFPSGLSQESEEVGSQPAWKDRREEGARPKLQERSPWQPSLPLPAAHRG